MINVSGHHKPLYKQVKQYVHWIIFFVSKESFPNQRLQSAIQPHKHLQILNLPINLNLNSEFQSAGSYRK